MNAKDAILTNFAMADRLAETYTSDLTDEELLVRPVESQNHIAWQLGHLIVTSHRILNRIRPGASPALPEGFEAHHGREEGAPASDDATHFRSRAEYLALWKAQRDAVKAVVADLSDEELDAPGPEPLRRLVPTVGTSLLFLACHELMHIGQFVGVRRKLNKAVLI